MKIGKITFLILVVSSFLVASMSSVVAADKTITDPSGDVTDIEGEIVTEDPNIDIDNIDIIEVTYTKEEQTVTLTLKVEGAIENRGDYSDLTEYDEGDLNLDIDLAAYNFALTTSTQEYAIIYVNNVCNLSYYLDNSLISTDVSTFSVNDNTLSIDFGLLDADETYDSVLASTLYMKFNFSDLMSGDIDDINLPYYMDEVNDLPLQIEIVEDSYDGLVGESINFDAFVYGGTEPYSYLWEFGDGKTSEEESPTHTYTEAGEYTVTFTVTGSGSSESDTATVTIIDENGESTDSNILIFIAIIALIAIVGAVVVIVIIRR